MSNQNAAIRLWRPLNPDVPDEPQATLTYGGHTFEIPYTLMHLMCGWIAIGRSGARFPKDADALLSAVEYLASVMGYDANPLTDEQLAFYRGHNIPAGRPTIDRFHRDLDARKVLG